MKKRKGPLWDKTDVKIFILCLLDEIRHPMTYNAIVDAVVDSGCIQGFDFAECFSELVEFKHIWEDTLGKEKYYMISDTGSMVARELRTSIPHEMIERAEIVAARHLALASLGVSAKAKIVETEDHRFAIHININDGVKGELLDLSVTVSTRATAEQIKEHCETVKAEKIYRAVLSVVTGEIDYFL